MGDKTGCVFLQALSQEARKCNLPDENVFGETIFKGYTQAQCEFECRARLGLESCKCLPWDFPRGDSEGNIALAKLSHW